MDSEKGKNCKYKVSRKKKRKGKQQEGRKIFTLFYITYLCNIFLTYKHFSLFTLTQQHRIKKKFWRI